MAKNESDLVVKTLSEAAESQENMKRDIEKNAEQTQKDREEALKNIFETVGKVKAMNFVKTQADFFNIVILKQIKDSKEYRHNYGMTWEQFCEAVGLKRRTVDEQLQDLQPFRLEFLAAFRQFSGIEVNNIKYLGMAVTGGTAEISDNAIIYNGETIPLDAEHKDDIQNLLETLEETHKKQTEETDVTIRTKDRLIKAKEDVIKKMDRELNRLQKTVKKTDLTEEEQDAVNLLAQVQSDFITGLADIKKKIQPGKAPEIALRQMYFLYIFISKIAMEERLKLQEFYRDAEEVPWEITEMELPPTEVLIDNAPLTAGKGMGKAYKERVEKRQQAKE